MKFLYLYPAGSRRSSWFVCAAWVLLTVSPCLTAQTRETIDLSWALQQTLQHNPELKAYPFALSGAEALRLQAGLRPVPTLGFTGENLLGNGEFDGTDFAEYTLSLSQVIELGEKREKRLQLAGARLQQLQQEYELARLDILAETGRRYYALLRLQSMQEWSKQRLLQDQRALDIVDQRARAGAVGRADVSKIRLRLARSESRQVQLVGELKLARLRLASLWLGKGGFSRATGALAQLPALPAAETIGDALDAAPELSHQLALQRLADSQVQLAQANGRGDLELGLGIRRLEISDDEALTFSVSMPLPFSNPNRGRIAAARAQQESSRVQAQARRQTLELSLLEILQRLRNQHDTVRLLETRLLPESKALLEDTEAGYQMGRYSVLQWVDAQTERSSVERELIETRTSIHLYTLELERITGQPMTLGLPGESS